MRINAIALVLLLIVSAGCTLTAQKNSKDKNNADFVRSQDGLLMEFVKNYPGDSYVVGNTDENILVVMDIRNKGTYGQEGSTGATGSFAGGKIFLSGFDEKIIEFDATSKDLSTLFLPAVSSVNPLGGLDTLEFDGLIKKEKITVDSYDPTILATLCYPYVTKASPTVCIDPLPFDDRQQKVCTIGSQTLSSQGAPIAITRIDEEAATNNIKFKITIKNVGKGDVLKPGSDENNVNLLDKCSMSAPADSSGKKPALGRKDFDKIRLEKVEIGSVDLFKNGKCGPFSDGSTDTIRLFNGEGFIICSLEISDLGAIPSAYTTPLNIELSYSYRSTASRHIKISKLTTIN